MDRDWAANELQTFIASIDRLSELWRIGRLIADDEEQTFRLENDKVETINEIETAEPIAQLIMEAVEAGLSQYQAEQEDSWGPGWRPAKKAALRALGLVQRGEQVRERLRSDAPQLSADQLHPWVWSAAQPMWAADNFPIAVLHAAQSINARLQQKVGRSDIGERQLCMEAFSPHPPKDRCPRLRFAGDRESSTWRSKQEGASAFGSGCFQAIRNPAAHSFEHAPTNQEALEELAALSRLARWIESCTVESISDTE